jgi:hypothetical protein
MLDESNVGLLGLIDLCLPLFFESLLSYNRWGHDEVGLRLVDIPLTELTIRESGAMANQLVGQRATDSLEQKGIVRVLENASMSLLLDVLEVFAGFTVGRVLLAHVAETAGKLCEPLAIGALSEPTDSQMIRLQKDWTREKGYYRLCIVQSIFRESETATEDYLPGAFSGAAVGFGLFHHESSRAAES